MWRFATRAFLLAVLSFAPFSGESNRNARVMRMRATAFVLNSKPTAVGTVPHRGIVAADPSVLLPGTRARITGTGKHDGIYTVTDTGARVDGRSIDIYMPSAAEAKRFGRKAVTVQVLEIGKGKQDARSKSIPAPKNKL